MGQTQGSTMHGAAKEVITDPRGMRTRRNPEAACTEQQRAHILALMCPGEKEAPKEDEDLL